MNEEERTLDPADWEVVRSVGHRMVDVLLDGLRDVRDAPAWSPMPAEVKARFAAPLPREGRGSEAVWEEVRRWVLRYRLGDVNTRFWARVVGGGTGAGVVGGRVTAAVNVHTCGIGRAA